MTYKRFALLMPNTVEHDIQRPRDDTRISTSRHLVISLGVISTENGPGLSTVRDSVGEEETIPR
jgi:hypothetical protein